MCSVLANMATESDQELPENNSIESEEITLHTTDIEIKEEFNYYIDSTKCLDLYADTTNFDPKTGSSEKKRKKMVKEKMCSVLVKEVLKNNKFGKPSIPIEDLQPPQNSTTARLTKVNLIISTIFS